MGPFFVLVDGAGAVIGDKDRGTIELHRNVGPHFFENAKAAKQTVRFATITLVGPEVRR